MPSVVVVRTHHDDDGPWAEVVDLPGCFAAGGTDDELLDGIFDALAAYLDVTG